METRDDKIEKKITIPPKDEGLIGAAEIYIDEDKISPSNPFGLSLLKPDCVNPATLSDDPDKNTTD